MGTFKEDEVDGSGLADVPPLGVDRVVSKERTKDFREQILSSDVIVYDLMTNAYEEVDFVIKTLQTTKLETEK